MGKVTATLVKEPPSGDEWLHEGGSFTRVASCGEMNCGKRSPDDGCLNVIDRYDVNPVLLLFNLGDRVLGSIGSAHEVHGNE